MTYVLFFTALFLLLLIYLICRPFIIRAKAIQQHRSEAEIVGKSIKLVLWKPYEGIVVLRNKQVRYFSKDNEGGNKFIFPMLGDELYARISTGVRDLTWDDDKVLTRESLQVQIAVVILWSIGDLKRYVFSIKTGRTRNLHERRLETERVAEKIIKDITDSTIRRLVSLVSLGELVSDKPTPYLNTNGTHNSKARVMSDNTETLKGTIETRMKQELTEKLEEYGILIKRVQIQSIQLAPIVQEAVNKAGIAQLNLFVSKHEAKALEEKLTAIANVIGPEATALNEIVKSLQGTTLYMLPPFLKRFFGMIDNQTKSIKSAAESMPELPEFDIDELLPPEDEPPEIK